MTQVSTVVTFDAEKGTVKFSLDLQGNTELDHELLAAAIGDGRRVSLVPTHQGEELFAEFVIEDGDIWPTALHNLENRRRVRDGKPTIEQEKATAYAQEKAAEAAKKAPKPPTAEELMSKAIADGIATGLKAAGVIPKPTPEPDATPKS